MARYRIKFNKKVCIGSGACASVCPENWELVETPDGLKAKPRKTEISEDEYDSNSQAADICPVEAIKIEKISSRKVHGVEEEEEEDYGEEY